MRYTHTSKPPSKCSTYIICRISWNFLIINQQIKEYNTKISTRPNTYDEEHNDIDTTPTAPQIPTLPQNHPLSLVPRNFRNLAITNNPIFRPNITQGPIQHIMTHHSQIDNTYEKIIEQPHTTTFQSQNYHFLAHDEPTNWIPPSLKFPSSQPPNSNPNYPTFAFLPPDSPVINIPSSMNSDTNSDISLFHTISQL